MARRNRSNTSRRRPAPSARLALLNLESRLTPSVTVLNANDSGAGSLRQAILDTNANPGPDTIDFDATFFATPQTINLAAASGQLSITDDLIITGPGVSKLTINGGGGTRIFNVDSASATTISVTISGMTVTGGNGSAGNGGGATDGGGIRTTDENLTLQNMVITGNTCGANDGGGITATTTAFITINNCTVSGNTAGGGGGGIYFFSGGGMLLENSTVSGNSSGNTIGGGGVYFFGTVAPGGFTIQNSTIANNTAAASGGGLVLRSFNGTALIQNSTITGNTANTTSTTAGAGGGGVAISSGSASSILTVQSSIISGNTASAANGRSDLATITAATSNVYNSAIGDPDGFTLSGSSSGNLAYGAALNLLGLANYGGPTATIALGVGSLAVDAGFNYAGTSFDQRGPGFPRQVGAGVDIGAFEGTLDVPTAAASGLVNVNVAGTNNPYTFQVTYSGSTPINTGTLDNNDIRITGPNGFNVLATRGTFSGPSTAVVVNYSFIPPANPTAGWDAGDNGTYTVALQANQVANTNGGFAAPGNLGTFQVLIGQNYVVTNLNDSGAGSLRQAILDANSLTTPDTISFQAGLTGTISLTSGELLISQPVAITGPGASTLTIDAGGTSRIFDVNGPGVIDVSISGLTITGGNGSTGGPSPTFSDGGAITTTDENLTLDRMVISNSTAGTNDGGGVNATTVANIVIRNSTISGNSTNRSGGGVYFFSGGSLLLENSTVSGNTSGGIGGGGLYFFGTVAAQGFTVRNSTITGNSATSGGGIVLRYLNTSGAPILIQNSTISGNTSTTASTSAGYGGGGISINSASVSSAIVTLQSSIVSGNTSTNGNDDIATVGTGVVNAYYSAIGDSDGFTLTGNSNNLAFGAALNLQPLAPNGGPTQTMALGAGSLALNAGYNPASLTTDQRGPGFVRVSGAHADIGAFESQGATAPTVTGISVNSGAQQRSRVTRLDVTFSTQVTFAGPVANAFTLVRNGGGSVGFTATANVIGGVTVVTLDGFTGGLTDFGSLGDGRYTLTVLANQISAGGVNMASNVTFNDTQGLFRMYGDVNADQNVNGFDLGGFRTAFGSSTGDPNFQAYFDFNADGSINGLDLGQFRTRFGTTLP
jgi:parallel beta-helix repeat protein